MLLSFVALINGQRKLMRFCLLHVLGILLIFSAFALRCLRLPSNRVPLLCGERVKGEKGEF